MTGELERRRVRLSAGDMACVDIGEGPPVLLLHGFPTSSYLWRREAGLLAQRMRVIAPDLLGYGQSEKPAGADLSEVAQAGHIRELLDRLEIPRLAIVGHDVGGAVAQLLVLDGGVDVRALVLIDSACFEAWPVEGVRMLQDSTPEQETVEFVEDIVRAAFVLGVAHQSQLADATVERYLAPWREEPAAFFRAARGITGRGLADRSAELARLDLPAFLLWGEQDPFLSPDLGERLQEEALPGAALALLPGCSHFLTEDAPQTVGPLIYEFLRARYLGESHHHSADGPVVVSLERPPRAGPG